jgi:type IV pilus assembly protein PilB
MDSIHSHPLNGFPLMLVAEGLLQENTARSAVGHVKQSGKSFINYLVDNKILTSQEIAIAGSRIFGVPYFDISAFDKAVIPIGCISEHLIRTYQILPLFRRDKSIFIASADTSQQQVLDEVKFHSGLNVFFVSVDEDKLIKLIDATLSDLEEGKLDESLADSALENLDISSEDPEKSGEGNADNDDAPVVRFVNKILLDAINSGASDIHFEPYENTYRVRYRQDGLLYEVANPPANLSARISSRLKIMSRLDISERRVPQDGRFKMTISRQRNIDFRVSSCPTVGGEKIVLRILDPASADASVEKLGFSPVQQKAFMKAIAEPQGMILVTGPTGSGKTVTLYTALKLLNTEERNISTAEDPVEIRVQGINQVNINTKTHLTFSAALRSFLRQDPDVIMVGEMRDLETAEIGIKAAQTGHLVLSTLHTNSAPETLTRLVNMGVAPFNIASSVSLIIAQRLARRLCDHCKKPEELPPEALKEEGLIIEEKPITIFTAVGCQQCTKGYKGRVGLFEVLGMTKTIGDIIMSGGNSRDIVNQARKEGMVTIRESGLEKVRAGVTSLEEINRVTKD